MLSLGYNNMLNMNNFNCGNMFNMGGYGNFSSFGSFGGFGTSLFGLGNFGYGNFGCNTGFGCGDNGIGNSLLYMLGSITPTLLAFGIGAAGCAIAEAKDNTASSLQERAADYTKDINTAINNLCEGLTISDYKNHKAEDETWYVDGMKTAKDTQKEQKEIMNGLETAYNSAKTTKSNYSSDKAGLQAKINAETDATEISKLETQLQELETNHTNALKTIEEYEEAKAAYDKAIEEEDALKTKAETRQEAIDKQIEKITNMIETQANVQKAAETKAVKKANGNSITRLSEDEYKNLFDNEGKVKEDAEVGKEALNKAFYNYSRETDEDKKAKIKEQIKDLWDKLPYEERTPTLRQAYTTMFS